MAQLKNEQAKQVIESINNGSKYSIYVRNNNTGETEHLENCNSLVGLSILFNGAIKHYFKVKVNVSIYKYSEGKVIGTKHINNQITTL